MSFHNLSEPQLGKLNHQQNDRYRPIISKVKPVNPNSHYPRAPILTKPKQYPNPATTASNGSSKLRIQTLSYRNDRYSFTKSENFVLQQWVNIYEAS